MALSLRSGFLMDGNLKRSLKRNLSRTFGQRSRGKIIYLKEKLSYLIRRYLIRLKPFANNAINRIGKVMSLYDVKRHAYITGMTGSGKTSLIEQWVYSQRKETSPKNNICIIYIDPHGDSVQKLKRSVLVRNDMDRLVYIDPHLRKGFTPCINPMEVEGISLDNVELHTQILVDVFEEMIPETKLSNYMKTILKPCISTILLTKFGSLKDIQLMMQNAKNERWLDEGKQSLILPHRDFFKEEYMNRLFDLTKNSIYTKLQSLVNYQTFYIFTTGESTVKLERVIRKGKVLLVNLSKGRLGEEVSSTIGRFLVAKIKSIALSRAAMPEHLRTPIYLVLDEADMLLSGKKSLSTILKETRKFGLHLIFLTQNIVSGKDSEVLKRDLLNNTYVKCIGMNGLSTLTPLSKETGIKLAYLQTLKNFEFCIKRSNGTGQVIKIRDCFGRNSPLLLDRHASRNINDYLIKNSGYYKPILTTKSNATRNWENMPEDMRQEALSCDGCPRPKFTL